MSEILGKYGIDKGARNEQQGFNFRGIDQVLNALSTPLVTAGLVILPRVIDQTRWESESKQGTKQFCTVVRVQFELVSVEDGSSTTVVFDGEAKDPGDKATSKALSMAYKYMAFQTFCIPVEGLDDADTTTPEPARAKPPTPANDNAAAAEAGAKATIDDMLATIAAAQNAKALAALKLAVTEHQKDPRWKELKEAYTARNAALKEAAA